MRIRCERCQAEYELDDAQAPSNANVQCSVCGHVFAVAQTASNETADRVSAVGPETVDWFLQTPDGGVHRFHGLTSLHKGIIDGRITRLDRVSSDGLTWQYAGELGVLVPFFDVVDETDRARPDVVAPPDQGMPLDPARRTPAALRQRRSSPQSMAISVPNDDVRDSHPYFPAVGMQAAGAGSHEHPHGVLKLFVTLTVAAAVAYAGIQWQRDRGHSTAIAEKAFGGLMSWMHGRRPLTRPPEARPDLGAGAAAAKPPGQMAMPSPSTKGPVVEALPSPPPAEPEKVSAQTGQQRPVAAPSESYEKLTADGDRALENGSDSKARDLYQRALRLRSAGPKALSGLGFVALDRGDLSTAHGFFKRALAAKSSFGPALFGMAEVHRARGEKALALQSYQRYLQLSPKGSEATVARRQMSALQTGK